MRGPEFAERLRNEFPGTTVDLVPPENSTMAICQLESNEEGSVSIAYIESMPAHYHNFSEVRFRVEEGEITVQVAGKQHTLSKKGVKTVPPGKVHSVSGEWARVRIESTPAWTLRDHTPTSRR